MEKSFLRYIHKRYCKFEMKMDKANEIEKGVKIVVEKVLERLAISAPAVTISKIIEGGSYYEQTKIGDPDEFDFMVVLKNLSIPSKIIIKKGCYPWYKKIYVSEDSKLREGFLFERNRELIIERVIGNFWTGISYVCQRETISVNTKVGTIRTKGCENHKLLLQFVSNTGIENPADYKVESKTTDCTAIVLVSSLEIGVDLMPAIEYPNIEEVLTSDGFPRKWTKLVKENGCYLVAKNCNSTDPPCTTCWHVTLATSELQLMRDIDINHKQCYQVVKYLLTREVPYSGKCANLSSYMLKNAFMFHVYGENACSSADICTCIHSVLNYMISNLRRGKMPCFLSRNISTWGPVLRYPVFASEKFPSRFMNDTELALEWYAVCWLELLRRILIRFQKLLREVSTIEGDIVRDKIHLMKESMMLLIECYCKHRNIQHEVHFQPLQIPKEISDSELEEKFVWYFGRLKELFKLKLGDLLEL